MKQTNQNFQLVQLEDKIVLKYKTNKVEIDICECFTNLDINNYQNWNPCDLSKRQGYAWVFNEMRPYRKYVKMGFLFSKKSYEFSVDLVSFKDNHFNDGYKNWIDCDECLGEGCDKCDFQGVVPTNIKHNNYCDHIIVMKRKYYSDDEILSKHTLININTKDIEIF